MESRFAGFFLGNSLFDDAKSFPPLPHCRNDASDLFEVLTTGATGIFNPALSVCRLDLTKTQLLEAIDAFFEPIGKGDTVLMYFASHGRSFGQNHFSLAMSNTRETNLSGTAFDVAALNSYFAERQIRSSILIFDCCRAGRVFDTGLRQRGITKEMNLEPLAGMGKWLIASCHDYQNAHELEALKHGVFTHYLIDGIRTGSAIRSTEEEFIPVQSVCIFASTQIRKKHEDLAQDPIYLGDDLKGQPVFIAKNPLFKPTFKPENIMKEAWVRIYSEEDLSDSTRFELKRREKLRYFVDQLPIEHAGDWRKTIISLYGEALGLPYTVLVEYLADAEARWRFETAVGGPAPEGFPPTARGFAALFSTGAREHAFALSERGSNFSYQFQQALAGAAADARGLVTVGTAFDFVRRRLQELLQSEGRMQKPVLHFDDASMREFVLTGQDRMLASARGRRRALLIATDTYPEGDLAPLPGDEALMSRMGQILTKAGAFDVRMLLGRDATRTNLLDNLQGALNESGPDDALLFYFVGHAGLFGEENALQLILFDSDYRNPQTLVSARELARFLRPHNQQKNVVIVDSSFAGAAIDGFQ
jgi:uncharacterized caspase-like protein